MSLWWSLLYLAFSKAWRNFSQLHFILVRNKYVTMNKKKKKKKKKPHFTDSRLSYIYAYHKINLMTSLKIYKDI